MTDAILAPQLMPTGPGQSDLLIHFCGRRPNSKFTPDVPPEIKEMTPQQRLDAILTNQTLLGFTPFRAHGPAVCLSESPGDHLLHMLRDRKMAPWGVLLRRADVIAAGGGGIAYPPEAVHDQWPPEIKVWGNPIRNDGQAVMDFSWEREWRIPSPNGAWGFQPQAVAAVLVGDPTWKPTPLATDWIDGSTGEPVPDPAFTIGGAHPWHHYPAAWIKAEHLYWDGAALRSLQ
ncbi:hypothetical protein E1293_17690 [Actinomadura darangshiensis]|uniref:Uncharacterized protein n=1 Tax=Actinomadura darangshiensis TaxID=705336 RepID=A0A4R5B7M8_9ACTN|nr:hypothetical protein [Actinomadura darangshiensis]TDD81941.1 hypothetical protein E1293_17690 [Actinomadura darangshiensis]